MAGGHRAAQRPLTDSPGQGPFHVAVGVGFEPTVTRATTVFKTVPLGRSGNPPWPRPPGAERVQRTGIGRLVGGVVHTGATGCLPGLSAACSAASESGAVRPGSSYKHCAPAPEHPEPGRGSVSCEACPLCLFGYPAVVTVAVVAVVSAVGLPVAAVVLAAAVLLFLLLHLDGDGGGGLVAGDLVAGRGLPGRSVIAAAATCDAPRAHERGRVPSICERPVAGDGGCTSDRASARVTRPVV